jgi:hypothetical protein
MIDLLVGGGIVSGLALGLRARRLEHPTPTLLLTGAAIGLAIGAKQTGLGPGVAVALAVAALQPRARWRALLTLTGGAAALSALWFLRLVVTTGNPLFPKHVAIGDRTIFDGGRGPLVVLETSLLSHGVALRGGPVSTWLREGARLYGPAIVLPLLAAPAAAVAWWRRRSDARAWATLAVAAVVAVSFAAYLATPYTGGGPQGLAFLIASQLRYAFPFALCGAGLAAAIVPRHVTAVVGVAALAFSTVKILEGPSFRGDVGPRIEDVALALLAAVVVLVATIRRQTIEGWVSRARDATALVAPAAFVALAAALLLLPGPHHSDPVAAAVRASGDPDGRVLLVGVNDVRTMLGPRFTNELVRLPGGGPSDGDVVTDGATFAGLVERVDPAVIVVGPVPDTAPSGWEPGPRWRVHGSVGANRVYVRSGAPPSLAAAGEEGRRG